MSVEKYGVNPREKPLPDSWQGLFAESPRRNGSRSQSTDTYAACCSHVGANPAFTPHFSVENRIKRNREN